MASTYSFSAVVNLSLAVTKSRLASSICGRKPKLQAQQPVSWSSSLSPPAISPAIQFRGAAFELTLSRRIEMSCDRNESSWASSFCNRRDARQNAAVSAGMPPLPDSPHSPSCRLAQTTPKTRRKSRRLGAGSTARQHGSTARITHSPTHLDPAEPRVLGRGFCPALREGLAEQRFLLPVHLLDHGLLPNDAVQLVGRGLVHRGHYGIGVGVRGRVRAMARMMVRVGAWVMWAGAGVGVGVGFSSSGHYRAGPPGSPPNRAHRSKAVAVSDLP